MKVKLKSKLNIYSFLILIIGGIGAIILGIILILKGQHENPLLFVGILFLFFGLLSTYWIFKYDFLEITETQLIIKSITGKTKKSIPLTEFSSYNEIEKQNAKYKGETTYLKWKDLILFSEGYNYKISSMIYSNYDELKSIITKGLIKNKEYKVQYYQKSKTYLGTGFIIFGIITGLWIGILSIDNNDKYIGGIIGLLFFCYGIYILNKK